MRIRSGSLDAYCVHSPQRGNAIVFALAVFVGRNKRSALRQLAGQMGCAVLR
jgi:hypothetical protein